MLGLHNAAESMRGPTLILSIPESTNWENYRMSMHILTQVFFLQPEQQRIVKSQGKKQFIIGASGSGKTFLLMLKALDELRKGFEITFLIPKSKEYEYDYFKKTFESLGKINFFTHEGISTRSLAALKSKWLYIDDLENFVSEGYINQEQSTRAKRSRFSQLLGMNVKCTFLDVCDFLERASNVVTVISNNQLRYTPLTTEIIEELCQHYAKFGFQIHHLRKYPYYSSWC